MKGIFNKNSNLLVLFILTVSIAFSQGNCKIKNEYGNIFKIENMKHGDKPFLVKQTRILNKNTCFSSLVNNNPQYFNYLLTHFSPKTYSLVEIKDSIKLTNAFIANLKNDSLFNFVMKDLVNKTNGLKTIDIVSVDDLLNIAVKFFTIKEINEKGHFVGKVCTGINGIENTEKIRKPQIEAFCFSTVLNNYYGEQFNMYNEFIKGLKELYKINFGVNDDEKLLRSQGALFMLMRNNDKLKELLIFEYEKQKQYLPFILILE